jgi:hypothetical protein
MTPQEHIFMLSMHAMQSAKFNTLVEILKTRGLLDDDDLQAFSHAAQETQEHREWFLNSWNAYLAIAKGLGVPTGLQDAPPPQTKA